MTSEIIVSESTSAMPDTMSRIMSMAESGTPPETLEKMLALCERMQENIAREQFGRAIAAFQAECPQITKRGHADRYVFARYEDIMQAISPALARHGISVMYDTEQAERALTIIIRVRVGTYYEDRRFTVPVPAELRVIDAQRYGANLSYARRYALCAALNIVVTNEDDERQMGTNGFISEAQSRQLATLIKAAKMDDERIKKFLSWAGADTIAEIESAKYQDALRMLRAAAEKGGK